MKSVLDQLSDKKLAGDISYTLSEGENNNLKSVLNHNFSSKYLEENAGIFLGKSISEIELPEGLSAKLTKFSDSSNSLGIFIIRNLPVDEVVGFEKNSSFSEAILIKTGNLLGKTYSYEDKRGGALVHNLVPVKKDAQKQLGSGSVELFWHTEDAHNKYNCDFIELLCLRGDGEAKTLACGIDPGELDPLYTKCDNDEAKKALDYLTEYVKQNAFFIALDKGDLLIVDNRKAVHSRSEYHPRFDGTDRWVQRVISLKKSVPSDRIVEGKQYCIKKAPVV